MRALWQADEPMSVRDVLEQLQPTCQFAYTTVLTVLGNLHRKGWADRRRDGRAFLYVAAVRPEQAAANALRDVLNASDDPESVLLDFARTATESELAALRKALRSRRR